MKTIIKYLLALQLMSILALQVSIAQIMNGDFQDYDTLCPYQVALSCECTDHDNKEGEENSTDHFTLGCVDYWHTSHGSPQYLYYGSNRWAFIWAEDYETNSEGICQSCTFVKNREYFMSIRMRGRSSIGYIDDVFVYIANGLEDYYDDDNDYYVPTSGITKQEVLHEEDFDQNPWHTYYFNFIPDANYTWLWIMPSKYNTGSYKYWVDIDNVSADACPTSETYSNTNSLPSATDRSNYIRTISGGIGVDVTSGQDVTFRAGNYVLLQEGFHAQAGSVFLAKIEGCVSSTILCYDYGNKWAGSEDTADYVAYEHEPVLHEPAVLEPFEEPEIANVFSVYPNPNSGMFNISINTNKATSVYLFDMLGNMVYQNEQVILGASEFTVDISTHPKGVYLLKAIQDDEVIIKRIIHQ